MSDGTEPDYEAIQYVTDALLGDPDPTPIADLARGGPISSQRIEAVLREMKEHGGAIEMAHGWVLTIPK